MKQIWKIPKQKKIIEAVDSQPFNLEEKMNEIKSFEMTDVLKSFVLFSRDFCEKVLWSELLLWDAHLFGKILKEFKLEEQEINTILSIPDIEKQKEAIINSYWQVKEASYSLDAFDDKYVDVRDVVLAAFWIEEIFKQYFSHIQTLPIETQKSTLNEDLTKLQKEKLAFEEYYKEMHSLI